MTMYQSLLMALVSLPFCVLERSKFKPDCSLSTQILDELTEVLLQSVLHPSWLLCSSNARSFTRHAH